MKKFVLLFLSFSFFIVLGRVAHRYSTNLKFFFNLTKSRTKWHFPPNPVSFAINEAKTLFRGATRPNPLMPSPSSLRREECVCPGDDTFCTPYESHSTARALWTSTKEPFLAAIQIKFGPDVAALWRLYLERSYGDRMDPLVFDDPSHPITNSFITDASTPWEVLVVLRAAARRLQLYCVNERLPTQSTIRLSLAELGVPSNRRNMAFNTPDTIAGNIAGGVGACEFGDDRRDISGYIYFYTGTPNNAPPFEVTDSFMVHSFRFEIKDCIDFCPGQCGVTSERRFTIPLSRLEATGWAYDVPYTVRYDAPHYKFTVPSGSVLEECGDAGTQSNKIPLTNILISSGQPPSELIPDVNPEAVHPSDRR